MRRFFELKKNLILVKVHPNRSFLFFYNHLSEEFTMALYITEECTYCGACEPECPVSAITAGDDVYQIDANACTECVGHSDTPSCTAVCPAECIIQA